MTKTCTHEDHDSRVCPACQREQECRIVERTLLALATAGYELTEIGRTFLKGR